MDKQLGRNLIQRVNVGDALTRTADRVPEHLAVVDGTRRFTYRQFNSAVNHFANGLLARGYRHGDVLALASGNSMEFLLTYFACAKTGVVCVPVNLGWGAKEIAYALEHSRARGVVMETQLARLVVPAVEQVATVKEIIVAPGTGDVTLNGIAGRAFMTFDASCADSAAEPEVVVEDRDPLSYLYTSGTTSAPKGVITSHVAVYTESLMLVAETEMRRDERIACLMPLFHTAQLNGFATPAIMVGATQFLLRGFDATALLDLIEHEKITRMFVLPMMWKALMNDPSLSRRDVSSVRQAAYAMAPMPDALLRQCMERFQCGFYLAFGQTEMSPVTTIFRPEHQVSHRGAVGTQVMNTQIAIMDAQGRLLPHGQEGEIVYRSTQALEGYLRNDEATDAAFAHGWFHSGDVGYLAADGMLWFSDRFKDVIKSGGENVASIEVEKAIYAAEPRVQEVAVIGLAHPHWIEAITAVVIVKPGEKLDAEELRLKMRTQLASFKTPKAVIVIDAFPRTATGKIQKNVLRKTYADYYTREKNAAAAAG